MPKHLEKISEEILNKNPWSTYKHDRYIKPNGKEGDYFYMEILGGSAMVVAVMPNDSIVLTLQHRYLADKQSIEFPAGRRKAGQTSLDVAKIELLEETGCIADEIIKIGVFESSPSSIKDEIHVYLAHVFEQRDQKLDDSEEIDILYRRPDEIDEMIKNNEIFNGPTMAAWSLVRHHLL
ncbi:MAG: NUDIX hydrolase [Candidatus Magasanikbacteria bacterium]